MPKTSVKKQPTLFYYLSEDLNIDFCLFTTESKISNGVEAGVHGECPKTEISISLNEIIQIYSGRQVAENIPSINIVTNWMNLAGLVPSKSMY